MQDNLSEKRWDSLAGFCYRRGSLSLASTVSRAADYDGRADYLIISGEMSGARGIVTAFARILVSEPCRPLGSAILHAGLGCRLSVPGLPGNSPDFHPPLARRRAFVSSHPWPISRRNAGTSFRACRRAHIGRPRNNTRPGAWPGRSALQGEERGRPDRGRRGGQWPLPLRRGG